MQGAADHLMAPPGEADLSGDPPPQPPAAPAPAPAVPPERPTGLLDLPDHLLGLLYAQQEDSQGRRAFYSSCRACRESPAINQLISQQHTLRVVEHTAADAASMQDQIATWPRHSQLHNLCLSWVARLDEGTLLRLTTILAQRCQLLSSVLTLGLTGPLRDITTLVPLLQLFPSLTSLSLLSRTISSCHSCAALISTLPASTLHTLYLGTACPDTSSANQCIQLIGRLTALRDLSISLDATVRPGSEKPVDQPLIHVGPLGALGQLQQLELVFDGIASVDAGSLCHIAAGCTQLQRLVIMSTHKQPVMSRSGPGSGSGSGAGASSTAAAAGVAGAAAWPSLRRLLLFATMEDLSGLFDLVFRSMPGLQYLLLSAVQIHIAPHTMTALYRKLAAAQWPNNLYLSLATPITWDQGSQGRPAREVIPARKVIPGIGQLAGRVARLNLEQLLLNEGDVAALAAALGPGLQELNFSFSWGPCGAAALEAVVGLPGLTTLLLPRAQPEPGWEDALLRACVLAQTSQQRTRPLTMQLRKDRPGFQELLDRWAGAWAALPQPQAGPMRVTLTQSQVF